MPGHRHSHDDLSCLPLRLLIDGDWRDAADNRRITVENPATGKEIAQVADAHAADATAALDAACRAQAPWAALPPRQRADLLHRAYEGLCADRDRFTRVISLETGKPQAEAQAEVDYAAGFLRWFAEEAVRIHGREQQAPGGGSRQIISRWPVGPCLLITPWNFPLAMITRKVGPALAAGCTMVLKPAEQTPLTAILFCRLMQEIALPQGVLNLITTTRADIVVGTLLADKRLRKLSFTGSTRVGRLLLAGAAASILRTSMELGGNNPFIVFDDADLDRAVDSAVQAKLRNLGQACTAANRFLVQDGIAAPFTERLVQRFAALSADNLGPMIGAAARANTHGLVQDAAARGARLVLGGKMPAGHGYYYPPTILTQVPADAPLLHQEIFGPVAPIQIFTTEADALAMANDSGYGLAAYACTRDLDRVIRLQGGVETGMLGINTGILSDPAAPFGGIKQSGLGREGGTEGIDEYLTTRYTAIATPATSGT
ncbi:NAD-dependent succinate-semialdehyde dehydrogenase [Niveispirillum fermenti]|uniref:NAD-dependent succinate-semialdehyde dehydrogenase n=1 Tax=Niveispirillum fermenti TaxID=1233113 RepID=UPI003A86359D